MDDSHHRPAAEADTARAELEPEARSQTDPMVAVYRHDVHKLRGRSHGAAADTYHGVPVNEQVPLHADRDGAQLSRPRGEPEQTVANHASPHRLSLLTGETAVDTTRQAPTGDSVRFDPRRIGSPTAGSQSGAADVRVSFSEARNEASAHRSTTRARVRGDAVARSSESVRESQPP